MLGFDLLQNLFICHEQCNTDGVWVVIAFEAADT